MGVLVVEHDMELVMSVCDRVVVLNQGRELANGTPDSVRSDPEVIKAYLGAEHIGPTATRKQPASAPDRSKLLTVSGLIGGYGDAPAVSAVDLEVHEGEVVALLGPNGAGKTTLLMTLVGELAPLGGTGHVLGIEVPGRLHRLAKAGVALVPEDRGIIPGLTCGENLRLGRGPDEAALEVFPELRPLLDRRAALLSGGEQQMLALGRALAVQPRVLLVDELSLGLGPQIVQRLLHAVRAAADQGTAVLLVEQYAGQALAYADRGYVLRNGQVVMSGEAEQLQSQMAAIERAYV
jgi:branched-chain amino acid transport system ATP-binding protein